MKLILLTLCLFTTFGFARTQTVIYTFCFDSTENCSEYNGITINDTINIEFDNNPSNNWEIGHPQKNTFNSTSSPTKAIVTKLTESYTSNDTSRFSIKLWVDYAPNTIFWSNASLSFDYLVDTDTLTDFGMIEFSPDNGVTWIDLLNDPNYEEYIDWYNLPILTGSSNGELKVAGLYFEEIAAHLNVEANDWIGFRFSFISDDVQTNRDGLLFDNIRIVITPPLGIEESSLNKEKKIYKIVDLLGRETVKAANTTQIYLYEDGTSEKVYIQE